MDVLLHLAFAEQWAEALAAGHYRWSTRGLTLDQVGFIHAAYPHQLQGVAERFYADVDPVELVRLTIDPARLAAAGIEVIDEPGDPGDPGSERFPHIYGALPVDAVVDAVVVAMPSGYQEPELPPPPPPPTLPPLNPPPKPPPPNPPLPPDGAGRV